MPLNRLNPIGGSGDSAPTPPPFPDDPAPWVRPADWLALPTISPGDQIFAGLFAIFDGNPNYVALVANKAIGTYVAGEVLAGGSGWSEGSVFQFYDGLGVVDAVDGGGGVTAFHFTTPPTQNDIPLGDQGNISEQGGAGTGTGFHINVTEVGGNGYTVDWGDGTVEDFDGGVTAEHEYDYDAYDVAEETLSTRGYKQVVITVTPQEGSDLTEITLATTPENYDVSDGWLDCAFNGSSLAIINNPSIIGYSNTKGALLEHIWLGENALTEPGNNCSAFYFARGLQSVEIQELNSMTDGSYIFYELPRLRSITLPDLPLCTTLYEAFYGDTALEKIVIGDCPLLEDGTYMCEGNSALRVFQMGQCGTDGTSCDLSDQFYDCYALTHVTFGEMSIPDAIANTGSWWFDGYGSILYLSFGDLVGDDTFYFNSLGIANPYLIQYIKIGNLPDVTSLANMCDDLEGLRIFEMGDAPLCESFAGAWQTTALESFVAGDMSAATTMASAFDDGALRCDVTLGNFPVCLSFANAFHAASGYGGNGPKQVTLGDIDGSADFTNACADAFNLRKLTVGNIIGTTFPTALFASAPALQEIVIGDCPDLLSMQDGLAGLPATQKITCGDFPLCNDFNQAFYTGTLREITVGNTAAGANFLNALAGDYTNVGNLVTLNLFDTSAGENFSGFLTQQPALQNVPAFDFSAATDLGSFVSGCTTLQRSQVFGARVSHSYAGCNLQVPALVEIFENLGESGGPIATTTLEDGGASWAALDTFELASPTGGTAATCVVDTVDTGAILTFTVSTPGTGFVPGAQIAPSAASGAGTGGLIEIATTGAGDQSLTVTNNPGTPYLTAAQIAIAEAKGWSVVTS